MAAPVPAPTPEQRSFLGDMDPTLRFWVVRGTAALTLGIGVAFAAGFVRSSLQASKEAQKAEAWKAYEKFESGFRGFFSTNSDPAPPIDSIPESVRPWARLQVAHKPLQEAKLDEAKTLYASLASDLPTSVAATGLLPGRSGANAIAGSIEALHRFESEHPALTQNPAPSEDRRARIVTELGTIEIGFYPDASPQHVDAFRKLIEDGFYVGTKFHRVVPGTQGKIGIVQGGDPKSKDDTLRLEWGTGSHGDGIPVEKNRLAHLRGAVAMAQPSAAGGPAKSSGCQFYIVTHPSPSLDRKYTVFGSVISGMDVVDQLSSAALDPNSDRPVKAVSITKTEIF